MIRIFLVLFLVQFLLITENIFAQPVSRGNDSLERSNLDPRINWPKPVDDEEIFSLTLFELFEYNPADNGSLTWDLLSWYGGDVNRLWIKTEGDYGLSSPVSGAADFQLLYGKLITPFFNAQVGARYEQAWQGSRQASRISAVLGLQGIMLYFFELETAVFIGEAGHLAGRLTASKDFLFTQRTVAQVRFESNADARHLDEFESVFGINNFSIGARMRYEIRREFAPYVGIEWTSLFGETADYRKRVGGDTSSWNAVAGVRAWY
ncbi:copper resistance protein B [bacterium]|nr:copper resistance protein B [bacterium]